jgi:integrase
MHLFVATDDLTYAGLSMAGFPIVLWEDMGSCVEVNQFLRYYLFRGAISSRKSWEPIARALYDYFSFLEAHDLVWNDIGTDEVKPLVALYRNYCVEKFGLKVNTLRQRITYVCAFYAFALRSRWITKLPYEIEERPAGRRRGFLAHLGNSRVVVPVPAVLPRNQRIAPKFLNIAQAKLLVEAAADPHYRMIIRCALLTGLRREELATLPAAYVVNPDRVPGNERNLKIRLDPGDGTGMKTKGQKVRDIYITRAFMADLYRYRIHLRGERATRCESDFRQLFLTFKGTPFANDGKGLERGIRAIGKKIGINVHPHMLRHTYATHTLSALQKRRTANGIEPLVFIQRQLGHSSIETTMIYAHLVDELADSAILSYSDELDSYDAGGIDGQAKNFP